MLPILLVDDDDSIELLVRKALEPDNKLVWASTLESARQELNQQAFKLILLDVELPDGNGFDFLPEIRSHLKNEKSTVLFLTGKSQPTDQVMGLSLGADDYITKPFNPMVLKARVEARIRSRESLQSDVIRKADLTLNVSKQRVSIGDRKSLDLTPLEFRLLHHFVKNEDHVLSRAQLIDRVWGDHVNVVDRTVDTHVSHLRGKLKDSMIQIDSVHGEGYRLVVNRESSS